MELTRQEKKDVLITRVVALHDFLKCGSMLAGNNLERLRAYFNDIDEVITSLEKGSRTKTAAKGVVSGLLKPEKH